MADMQLLGGDKNLGYKIRRCNAQQHAISLDLM